MIEYGVGEAAFERGGGGLQPFAQSAGVPVQDEARDDGADEAKDEDIAPQRDALAGRGDVIECIHLVVAGQFDRGAGGAPRGDKLHWLPAADVGRGGGQAQVDMKNFNIGGDLGESVDQRLHHDALAVVGRGNLSKDE